MHPFKTVKTFVCLVIASALFLMPAAVRAATITWTNTSGGNWNTAANWSPNTVPGSGDSAVITNSGSYTVALNVNATVSSLTLGGASGTQTFSANSRTFTLNGASVINGNGVISLENGATLNGPGTVTNAVGGTINSDNSTINAALVNQGLMVITRPLNLGGAFENQAGATARVLGAGGGVATLTVANGFTNSGLIELTSVGNAQGATLNVGSGSLVNAAGGQINALAGTGGGRTLGVQLDNRGTVTINQALTLNGSSADHLNSGTINITGGDFTLRQSGSTPTFTNTGTNDIGSGRTFTMIGGTFNYNAGTVGGAGALNLNATVANFTPNFINATTLSLENGATLNGPGTVTNAVGGILNADNSTINAALVNQGLMVITRPLNLGGAFENQAGATARVLGAGGAWRL